LLTLHFVLYSLIVLTAPNTAAPSVTEKPAKTTTTPIPAGQEHQLKLGSIHFLATTNLGPVKVHGEAQKLNGTVQINQGQATALQFTIPVESLNSGMNFRDKDMRKDVFRTKDGKLPALQFHSDQIQCQKAGDGYDCQVSGQFAIQARPAEIHFKMHMNKETLSGQTKIKLSAYSIEDPSRLGVTVNDGVQIDFKVKY